MTLPPRHRVPLLAGLFVGVSVLGLGVFLRLSRQVQAALQEPPRNNSPLSFAELPAPPFPAEFWGGGEVETLAVTPASLLTAGTFGIADESGGLSSGLPSLRVSALALWRGHPVIGLGSGGLFLRREGRWAEARSGFDPLQVRTLLEGPGGELWIGARQGLFLAAWGAASVERIDAAPVRALNLAADGTLLAGGEQGLKQVMGRAMTPVATPDPWIDWVGLQGRDLLVLTPLGLARGPLGGTLLPVPGGQEVQCAAQSGNQVYAIAGGRLLRFDPAGRPAEERLPVSPRRVLAAAGLVFADSPAGLYRKTAGGWTLARPRPASLPPGPSHVNALALWKGNVVAGLFDGGIVTATGPDLAWRDVPGSAAWGVNALLPADNLLFIASLRGAARFDGRKFEAVGSGSAFSLARTRDGIAIGYGHGVQLPDDRFLSAFHGLPGNQALALAFADGLWVGTPSGLGAIDGSRVAWRVVAGDGRLPNPWVTALEPYQGALFIGSYGGGVVRRTADADGRRGPGHFDAFLDTQGFKVNQGCLRTVAGRLYLGTEGRGLFRLSDDGTRFVPLRVPLPSPRVTALLQNGSFLLVGTDEGLARLPLSLLREGS